MSKVAVVIGASRGIGLELCKQLKAKNFQVHACVRKTTDALTALNVERVVTGIDVSSDTACAGLTDEFKGVNIDVLIHNAGVLPLSDYITLADRKSDFSDVQNVLNINSVGPMRTCKALENNLKEGSKIALITSRMGSIGDGPGGKAFAYRMSKTALNMFGANYSSELKPRNIPLIILHPGMVFTEMTSGFGVKPGEGQCITTETSAEGLLDCIDKATMESTGKFFHYSGKELPW